MKEDLLKKKKKFNITARTVFDRLCYFLKIEVVCKLTHFCGLVLVCSKTFESFTPLAASGPFSIKADKQVSGLSLSLQSFYAV